MAMNSPAKTLLAIDGSPSSDAAVNEVAHSTLVKGSAVEVLTVIHSRVPIIPDPAFTMLALRAEDLLNRNPILRGCWKRQFTASDEVAGT